MESFVEDLLNLKLLNEGILKIEKTQFDPTAAIEFVVGMFQIKAKTRGLKLFHEQSKPRSANSSLLLDQRIDERELPLTLIGD